MHRGFEVFMAPQLLWLVYPAHARGLHKSKAQTLHSFAGNLPFPATSLPKRQHPALLHPLVPKTSFLCSAAQALQRVPGEKRRNPFSQAVIFNQNDFH